MKIFSDDIQKYYKDFFIKTGKSVVIVFAIVITLINPVFVSAQVDGVTLNINQLDLAANLWHIEDLISMITIEYQGEENLVICIAATITNVEKGSFVCVKGENYELSPEPFPQPMIRSKFGNTEITGDDPNYTDYIKDVTVNTGTLPAGSYRICVEAYDMKECISNCDGSGVCDDLEIFSPSPPELIYPADESEISEELPMFSWLPPMPSYGMESYTLQIVEINDGQSPMEAMEANSPWFIKDDIEYNSFQLSLAEREFLSGQRYAWKVSASIGPKGEKTNAIVVSSVQSFTYRKLTDDLNVITDPNFSAACKLLKDNVDIKEGAKIYGVIDPIPEGATIEAEMISDFERMKIENEPFLFIIDDEPGERFGHPVHYILVDTEFNTVKVFDANWWPVIRHSIERFVEAGDATLEELEMELLRLEEQKKGSTTMTPMSELPSTVKNDIDAEIAKANCGKWFVIIDGGDFERTGTITEQAKRGASKANLLEKDYKKKGYNVLRFSQLRTEENKNVKYLPVDAKNRAAANTIKTVLDSIYSVFISKDCCLTDNIEFELGLYIWAHAQQDSTVFMVYDRSGNVTPEGDIADETIDYREDILNYLLSLPVCVNLTLLDIDDCFTGNSPAVEQRLKSELDMLRIRGKLELK